MAEHRVDSSRPARRWPLAVLAAAAVWLLLQNSLLLVWFSSQYLAPAFAVARALIKVGLHLATDLWMLPVAVMLGVALALGGGERNEHGARSREVSRV